MTEKAILVIDMPESCIVCPLHVRSDWRDGCTAIGRNHENLDYFDKRENWCPLELPINFISFPDAKEDKVYIAPLKKKQIPKKVKITGKTVSGDLVGTCPVCEEVITEFEHKKYCPECGQRITWEEEK